MTQKSILACLLLACMVISLFCPCVIFAEEEFSFNSSFNPSDGRITLTGTADGYITVRIAHKDVELSELTADNLPLVFNKIHADGDFSFTVRFPDNTPPGKYVIYLKNNSKVITDSIVYFDLDTADEIVETKLKGTSLTEFKTIVKSDAEYLGIDTDAEIYKEKSDKIISLIYCSIDDIADGIDFYDAYTYALILASFDGADRAETESILQDNYDSLGIDYALDYESDTRLSDDSKNEICTLISKKDFAEMLSDDVSFKDYLSEIEAISAVRTVKSWQAIEDVLEKDFKDDFKFIFAENDDYDKLSSLSRVYMSIYSDISGIDDAKALQRLFDDAVQDELDKKESDKKPSGNSGGGGGGFTLPKDEPPVTPPVENSPADSENNEIAFKDLSSSHWSYTAVDALCQKNIISGYEDNSFKPEQNVTRAEFIKMLVVLCNYDLTPAAFDDVAGGTWYDLYIGAAQKYNVANGSDNKFYPDNPITREEAAALCYRTLSNVAVDGNNISFTDESSISDYAKAAVEALSSMGIIKGYSTGEFAPRNNITRAEAASMLYGLMNK